VRAIIGEAFLPLGTSSEALMTKLVELPKLASEENAEPLGAGRQNCIELEEGNILFSPNPLVKLPDEDIQFLVSQSQGQSRFHKNTAYRPVEDRLTGYTGKDAGQTMRLRGIMREYSRQAVALAAELLAPYKTAWRLDFASYRACEEQGRQMRSHARNDLLHVDSFPTRPLNGNRILRIFTNLNPSHPRVWNTSLTFDELAEKFAGDSAIPLPRPYSGPHRMAIRVARTLGFGSLARSPYDRWMLKFHHFLKGNEEFQRTTPRSRWEFPPQSTWLVFTDMVSHAVLSGQFALEQTFIVSRHSLVDTEKAPVSILERMAGCPLTVN
jgi:hypothetical protein